MVSPNNNQDGKDQASHQDFAPVRGMYLLLAIEDPVGSKILKVFRGLVAQSS